MDNKVNPKRIELEDLVAFARRQAWTVLLRGAVSLGIVVALLALYYAFAPRRESYRVEVQVTLESSGSNKLHYPNGRPFSSEDLIASPVLHRVWTQASMEKIVDFDDFCKWFALVGFDKDRAKLDAEYQMKMSKRNISVTELASLQKEYESKIGSLSPNVFTVSMCPGKVLNRERAVEVLGSVPKAWHEEYSIVNAPQIPAVMRPEAIRIYWKDLQEMKGRSLELLDTLRRFLVELRATCTFVRKNVLAGRNAIIDGVDLGVHEAHLEIYSAELLRLKNLLLENGDPKDLGGYVKSRLDDMACDELESQKKIDAVRQSLDVLNETIVSQGATKVDGQAGALPITMQTDGGFFAEIAQLVRKDSKQEAVRKYVDQLTDERRTTAELAARKLYYDQIEAYIKAAASQPKPVPLTDEVKVATERMVKSILTDGESVIAFRDKALRLYRTRDQFYVLADPVHYGRSFTLSLARLALGLLALWFLYNLLCLVSVWNAETKSA